MSVVLVTGASKGIGLSTAIHLSYSGFIVFAGYRTMNSQLKCAADHHKTLKPIFLDVTLQDSVDKAIKAVLQETHRIDVLINNAGIGIYGPTELHTDDQIRLIFETNFMGVIRMNKAVLPIMREQKQGKIINISSVSGLFPSLNLPVYSAMKAALEQISPVDKAEYAKWGIRVFMIHPGPVATDFEESTPLASRELQDNPYPDLQKRRAAWKALMEKGQSPLEVAYLIHLIIQDGGPFWNPTSEEVAIKTRAHFVDPTGRIRVPMLPKL